MSLNVYLNEMIIIGLCLIPAGVVLCILAGIIFQSWEMAALGPMAVALYGCWIAAVIMILLGIGAEIH